MGPRSCGGGLVLLLRGGRQQRVLLLAASLCSPQTQPPPPPSPAPCSCLRAPPRSCCAEAARCRPPCSRRAPPCLLLPRLLLAATARCCGCLVRARLERFLLVGAACWLFARRSAAAAPMAGCAPPSVMWSGGVRCSSPFFSFFGRSPRAPRCLAARRPASCLVYCLVGPPR